MRAARAGDAQIGAYDGVRGPAAAALVHPDAQGTGLIPTQVLDEQAARRAETDAAIAGRRHPRGRIGHGAARLSPQRIDSRTRKATGRDALG